MDDPNWVLFFRKWYTDGWEIWQKIGIEIVRFSRSGRHIHVRFWWKNPPPGVFIYRLFSHDLSHITCFYSNWSVVVSDKTYRRTYNLCQSFGSSKKYKETWEAMIIVHIWLMLNGPMPVFPLRIISLGQFDKI